MRLALPSILVTCGACVEVAPGQGPPDYDFTWRTVGDPGNAPAQQSNFPFSFPTPRGGVSYEFRMSRTEVTVGQWFQFVQAYTTVYPDTPIAGPTGLTGTWIYRDGSVGHYQWHTIPGSDNLPADMPWMYAAIYCNWLCNGRAVTAAAFANGAYDTSTFYPNPGDPQVVHTPGAQFWLPTIDEWVKAMFYDSAKFGPGNPGYWQYPIRSDVAPVGGPPGTPGAQTGNGNFNDPNNPAHDYPVGSYPNTQSPWGLLDGSGGVGEWAEGLPAFELRDALGTSSGDGDTQLDRIDRVLRFDPFSGAWAGLRIASSVPSPGAGVLLLISLTTMSARRKRT